MKDKLITFETAQLAKEKGFNEQCMWMYSNKGVLSQTKMDMYEHPNEYANVYAAPTQSLLQKWLRKEHNIHIGILGFLNGKFWICKVYEMVVPEIQFDCPPIKYGESYSEAIEKALQEALEVINA